ncbi:hypothetical protein ACFVXE_32330 [Streptomyces sp. NPDC058231]|uniref:hypothetical protein n=1 Tax=Streptomyces sp. NPDC058231 TaxID=3346392 RepID=UPI0036F10A8F
MTVPITDRSIGMVFVVLADIESPRCRNWYVPTGAWSVGNWVFDTGAVCLTWPVA